MVVALYYFLARIFFTDGVVRATLENGVILISVVRWFLSAEASEVASTNGVISAVVTELLVSDASFLWRKSWIL